MAPTHHPANARFVWTDPHGRGRNVFVAFRRVFRLAKPPARARLHLFADTRYRLRVNGAVAGYGPARFYPGHPQFDTVDLALLLRGGHNEIAVEVNSFGSSSFQSVSSVGGFIAWGKIGVVDMATPGDWQACRVAGTDPWAPPFSFAIGPVEIRDLRTPPGVWRKPVLHENPGNWGVLTPRPTPDLSLRERFPERLRLVAPVLHPEERIGYRLDAELDGMIEPRTCFALTIHSPVAQEIALGLFWGAHFLNGVELRHATDENLGNRQTAVATLRAGANFLYGEAHTLAPCWTVMLGLPKGKGLRAEGLRCTGPLPLAEIVARRQQVPASAAELPDLPWLPVPPPLNHPAREMGWDIAGEPVPTLPENIFPLALPADATGSATAVYDFGGEFLGHALIELEAPAGTVLDVANDEVVRPDGPIHLFKSHWGVNSADRFILRGGAAAIEGFHPRGGRYLQLTVRNATGPVVLRRVGVRQTTTPVDVAGRFECGDPVLNWTWQSGRETVLAGLEDSYADSPWRERGTYLGDGLVEFHTHRLLTAELSVPRRTLWLFALGQRADGLLPACAPSHLDEPLADFTLIWVRWLHDYWAFTGDRAAVGELWPTVERVLNGSAWNETASGLWDADALHVFTDWSATPESKRGENGVLNALRFRALECAATLAGLLGKRRAAARYAGESRRVARAFQALWDTGAGRFAAQKRGDRLSGEPALHANILALAFGLARRQQVKPALDYVVEATAWTRQEKPGRAELYFFFYLLEALYRHGRADVAEQRVREVYGDIKRRGYWTLPETYDRAASGIKSHCHAWSSGPSRHFIERILGLRQARPGDTRNWIVAPDAATVTWARGAMPTPHGPIEVEWDQFDGKPNIAVRAPEGVSVRAENRKDRSL